MGVSMKTFPQNLQDSKWNPASWQVSQVSPLFWGFLLKQRVVQVNSLIVCLPDPSLLRCFPGCLRMISCQQTLKRPHLLSFYSFCQLSWKSPGNLDYWGVLKLAYFARLPWGLCDMIIIKCRAQCLPPCWYCYNKPVTSMIMPPPATF